MDKDILNLYVTIIAIALSWWYFSNKIEKFTFKRKIGSVLFGFGISMAIFISIGLKETFVIKEFIAGIIVVLILIGIALFLLYKKK